MKTLTTRYYLLAVLLVIPSENSSGECAPTYYDDDDKLLHNIWGLVEIDGGRRVRNINQTLFHSPIELCSAYSIEDSDRSKSVECNMKVVGHSSGCLVVDYRNDEESIQIIGVKKHMTIIERISTFILWDRVFALIVAVCTLSYFRIGVGQKNGQRLNILAINIAYFGIASYLDVCLNHNGRWFSNLNTVEIVQSSFEAFKEVHPVNNVTVAMCHFMTYWIPIARYFAGNMRSVLIWSIVVEIVLGIVNEWTHFDESQSDIRCMREAFIHEMKETGYDNMIREFMLGPIFVYCYLLPVFIFHWGKALLTQA